MQSMMYTMTVGNGQVTKTCSVVISIQAQVTQAPILYYPAYQQAVPFSQSPILFQPIRTPYVSNATGNYGNSGNYYTSNWYSPSDAYNTYNIGTSYPYSYGGLSYNCVGGGLNGESLCYGTSNGSLVGAGYGYTYPIDSPIVGAGYGYTFPLGSSYETSPSGAGTGAGDVSPYVQITGPPGDTYQVTSNSANILNFDNSSSNTGFQVTPNSSNWLNFDNSNPNADSQVTQYPSNLLNFDNNSNATLYVQPDSPQLFYGPDGSFDPGNLDSSPSDKFFQPDNTPLNI
jgi:hypothetical protein